MIELSSFSLWIIVIINTLLFINTHLGVNLISFIILKIYYFIKRKKFVYKINKDDFNTFYT